ncbi:hypothetical protein FHY18_000452 [Xanthomonas arboricola]|uniref:hypothetical protein n=1 Tax=Xanthomonas sp. 3793 TaxID=3035312 RepID=UPI00216A4EEF|nr:hypothetical protein [Xanthomonas sp. 3793]MCS3744922.1 hypothetical protein [Xanthomonas sp. 3793]
MARLWQRDGTLRGDAEHCNDARIADDAPDRRLSGLIVVAGLIAARHSIAAVNRIHRSSSHFYLGKWE